MPTMYNNRLVIRGNEEDLKEFTKEFNLDLSNLCPLSSDGTDEEQREERYQKWGCKYAHVVVYEEKEERIWMELEEANGPIVPWVLNVTKHFPDLQFDLRWDGHIEAGVCKVKNGKGVVYE